jgi:hypothetical protein
MEQDITLHGPARLRGDRDPVAFALAFVNSYDPVRAAPDLFANPEYTRVFLSEWCELDWDLDWGQARQEPAALSRRPACHVAPLRVGRDDDGRSHGLSRPQARPLAVDRQASPNRQVLPRRLRAVAPAESRPACRGGGDARPWPISSPISAPSGCINARLRHARNFLPITPNPAASVFAASAAPPVLTLLCFASAISLDGRHSPESKASTPHGIALARGSACQGNDLRETAPSPWKQTIVDELYEAALFQINGPRRWRGLRPRRPSKGGALFCVRGRPAQSRQGHNPSAAPDGRGSGRRAPLLHRGHAHEHHTAGKLRRCRQFHDSSRDKGRSDTNPVAGPGPWRPCLYGNPHAERRDGHVRFPARP